MVCWKRARRRTIRSSARRIDAAHERLWSHPRDRPSRERRSTGVTLHARRLLARSAAARPDGSAATTVHRPEHWVVRGHGAPLRRSSSAPGPSSSATRPTAARSRWRRPTGADARGRHAADLRRARDRRPRGSGRTRANRRDDCRPHAARASTHAGARRLCCRRELEVVALQVGGDLRPETIATLRARDTA